MYSQEEIEYFIDRIRQERNKRIAETDYVHIPDVNITEEYKTAMNTYRQQLRDFPDTIKEWLTDKDLYSINFWEVPWPEKPN